MQPHPGALSQVKFPVALAFCLLLFFFSLEAALAQQKPNLTEDVTPKEELIREVPGENPEAPSEALSPPGLNPEEEQEGLPLPFAGRAIVLDPGHGGKDSGSRGPAGLQEKDLTLAVALKVADLLQRELGIRVVLTRRGDAFLPLRERTAIANNQRAGLFISIHADGTFRGRMSGAAVFYGASKAPLRPHAAKKGEKDEELQAILWDMAQTDYLNESARLASILSKHVRREGALSTPLRRAALVVLEGARMPAVLLSLGYITNPEEEVMLQKEEERERLARGISDAIREFLSEAAATPGGAPERP